MTLSYTSYKWCDTSGYWHWGYPAAGCTYTKIIGCDAWGSWYDCTPVKPDGYVDGTGGNDLIDINYTGDPQGDRIDANDQILAGEGANDDIVRAGAGHDTVRAGNGNDDVFGGTGDDKLYGEAGDDILRGDDGNDSLFGGDGHDKLYGGEGHDTIAGGAGNDHAEGGNGNDKIEGNGGDDALHGGAGDDTIYGDSASGSTTVPGATGVFDWQTAHLDGANTINVGGTPITVTVSTPTINGQSFYMGTIAGGAELISDNTSTEAKVITTFSAPVENVSFELFDVDAKASCWDDKVTVIARDVHGNIVPVNFVVTFPHTINGNTIEGSGNYSPDIEGSGAKDTVTVTIAGPIASLEIIHDNGDSATISGTIGISDLKFSTLPTTTTEAAGNDVITGGDGNDVIYGGAGNDYIQGQAGDDVVYGGDGNDVIDDATGADQGTGKDTSYGGNGDDTIWGGLDDDHIYGDAGNDVLDGEEGNDAIDGGAGRDLIYGGSGNDTANGGADDDEIWMGTGDDVADGGTGKDWIHGQAGNDALNGGADDDMLFGEEGDDVLDGGDGSDLLSGGNDRDLIKGGAGDTVDGGAGGNDFDVLDLTGKGPFYLDNVTTDSNGNGINGTVVFVDVDGVPTGETFTFTEIEQVRGEEINRGPVANDDTATTDEDAPVTIDVLANDTDADGDTLTITSATVPADQGTVEIVDGKLVFTPAENFSGEATITYTVDDGNGGTDTGTVAVTVDGVNDGPDAVDAADTTDFNTAVTVDLLANDTDVDGDTLTVTAASVPAAQGTLVNNGDGTVTFTPAAGFTGVATISYTITDGNGGTDSAVHSVTVGEAPLDGTVEGTAGDDVIDGGYLGDPDGDRVDNNDAILPGDTGNDDLIYGFGGNDTILAGDGEDEVYGGTGDDVILGQGGNDTLYGDEGDDSITGGRDEDTIIGGIGNDTLDGKSGDDVIRGGNGDDVVIGGGGNDSLAGGDGNDSIYGDNNDDVIDGCKGDDLVYAGSSDDSIQGGEGNDTLYGDDGEDSITAGIGNDIVDGGNGDDIINAGNHVNPLPDVAYPGVYGADTNPTNDLDTVYGGAGNDIITTGDDDDDVYGGTGADTIDVGFDDDFVEAGTGNDTIIGGEGNDEIYGEDGDDLIYGGLDDSAPDLVNIPDDGTGPFGPDLVTNNNNDTLFGGAGDDTIYGKDDDDTLFGGVGDDTLDGGVDDDELVGDEGDDTIIGGQGNDAQFGGFGSDVFVGGNGGDVVTGGEDPDDGDTDILDLTGSNVDFITYTDGDPESGVVTFVDGSTMTFSEIENVIPCFTPGTTIATPKGERLVEELQVGDRVITRDNGIQEIAWVGHKEMSGKHLVQNPHLRPILIKAGSLGHDLPERDMLVSPNHRVLVASDMTQLYFDEREVLAAAKHLLGAKGIHQVDVMQTTYVHFMFERHEVVLSNGSWTESFQPGDYSLKGIGNSQRNEIFELFPELASKEGLETYQSARKSLKKHEARLLVR